jgi:hypothetical protein
VEPSPPAEPVRSGDRSRLAVVLAGAALLIGVGVLAVVRAGGRSSVAAPDLQREYATAPEPCAAPPPADVRTVRPRRFEDSCTWELLRPDRSRSFEVSLQLVRAAAGVSGSVQAAKSFADDLAYSSDTGRNGGFERDPEHLTGLGDEAYAAQATNLIVSGRSERTATSYDLGGAKVEVRSRNVLLTVTWRGADYPAGVRGHRRLVGTRLPYPDAKREAMSVAGLLLRRLR